MPRFAIDDEIADYTLPATLRVSEVLNELIASLPPNRIVTRILLNGTTLGSGTALPHTLDNTADSIEALEIKTVDKEIWSVNGLDVAISSAERVQKSLIRSAELFRDGTKGEANQYFVQCVDGLEKFYEAILITRSVLRLDFAQISLEGLSLASLEKDFSAILASIIGYQEACDYAGLADKVECELIPHLSFWLKILRQLRLSQQSNA